MRHRTASLVLLACAFACTSCAAGRQLNVPVPRAGEAPLRWPPVPVDGYETADGVRHDLPGGYMLEAGDSLLFLPDPSAARPALLSARPARKPVSLPRDSVRSIAARFEAGTERPDPAGLLLGGAVLLAVVSAALWASGVLPWLIWAGSS